MQHTTDRREFLQTAAAVFPAIALSRLSWPTAARAQEPLYRISLAEWSLHKALWAGQMDNLEFPVAARQEFGIDAVEYVNQFFKDRANDRDYLGQLAQRCSDHGVTSLLIMCDGEGALGDPDDAARTKAVENHYRWVEAQAVDHPRCGTLPDFGNFRISEGESYDRYKGVAELMPYAKAVSAKANAFDEEGNETGTDYERMMRIVLDAGYRGYVGIEYEGAELSEADGIRATKQLLERVRDQLAPTYR
jgi:sugar phosphate isomerase/epimerase